MKRRIWAILMMMLIMLQVINIPVSAKDLGIYHSDPDMIVVYDGKGNFETDKNLMLYDFSDTKESGIGRDNKSYFNRMLYGLTARIKDNRLYLKVYNDYKSDFDIKLEKLLLISDTKTTKLEYNNKTKVINCDNQTEGLYIIRAKFSNDTSTDIALYIKDNFVTLCSYDIVNNSILKRFKNRRKIITNLIDKNNIIPEEECDFEDYCYPWSSVINQNDETELWRNLSYKITDEDQTDSQKLFAIHEWMCENLAYDYYRLFYLNGQRALYHNDFSGRFDTYLTKTGVCFDFVNILAIMCREQNIPCVTIDNLTHTWNLVYVNNNWIEIDMTMDIKNSVMSEDMVILKSANPYCYDGFGSLLTNAQEPLFINDALWSNEKALGIKSTQTSLYKQAMISA